MYPCYSSGQEKIEILHGLLTLNCMLFFLSYPNFMLLKHQHVVWVRSASVVPKRNIELMTHCYFWVRETLIVPKCNNRSLIPSYIWIREMLIVPKCNNRSLICCYIWIRLMPIVLKLQDGVSMA